MGGENRLKTGERWCVACTQVREGGTGSRAGKTWRDVGRKGG